MNKEKNKNSLTVKYEIKCSALYTSPNVNKRDCSSAGSMLLLGFDCFICIAEAVSPDSQL